MKSLAGSVDDLLPSLLSAFGPPGRESGVRAVLRRALRGLGRVTEDPTGNLHLHRPGKGPRLLVAAPMDAPGVIVTRVDATGLARVAILGNRSPAELVGAALRFEDDARGILGCDRPKGGKNGAEMEADQLFLETGLGPKEANRRFRVGSVGAIEDRPIRLGDLWCASNLDNRAGCTAVVAALRAARSQRYDLHVIFSAQSDAGARGAVTGAFGVDPEAAVVVDVAHVDPKETGGAAVGKGPCLGLKESGFLAHPEALALVKRAAAGALTARNSPRSIPMPMMRSAIRHSGVTTSPMKRCESSGAARRSASTSRCRMTNRGDRISVQHMLDSCSSMWVAPALPFSPVASGNAAITVCRTASRKSAAVLGK